MRIELKPEKSCKTGQQKYFWTITSFSSDLIIHVIFIIPGKYNRKDPTCSLKETLSLLQG